MLSCENPHLTLTYTTLHSVSTLHYTDSVYLYYITRCIYTVLHVLFTVTQCLFFFLEDIEGNYSLRLQSNQNGLPDSIVHILLSEMSE